ncbi:MAG: hypothetical protein IJN90_05010 [Bacilli bacterium]|nr:hypothetical protein [Bacilli bacterium]
MKNTATKIKNKNMLNQLINDIKNKKQICEKFTFESYNYKNILLKELKIDVKKFNEKYYYFNMRKNLHISESENNYFLISTIGIVMYNEKFKNKTEKIVFAFESQAHVLEIILEKIKTLIKKNDIYDIDSYNYNYLMQLTTGLSNNLVLFLELLAKAYITLNNKEYPKRHDLVELLSIVQQTMFSNKQNDTTFHAIVYKKFEEIVKAMNAESDDFIEPYIKYNESSQLGYILKDINELKNFIEISIDTIMILFYGDDDLYFKQGLFQRLMNRAKTNSEKEKIRFSYKFLIDSNFYT